MSFVRESTPLELACCRIVLEYLLGVIDWEQARDEAAPYGLTWHDMTPTFKQLRRLPHWDLMHFADGCGARKTYEILWDPVTEDYLQKKIAERAT
jgi:hypothetical protein